MDYKLVIRDPKSLVVVFSPVHIPKGKFGFSRFFEKDERSFLFFNCENTWYLDSIDDIKETFNTIFQKLNPTQVVFYGASMGGYAAARLGGCFPEYPTFIFGSEIRLFSKGSLSLKHSTIICEGANLDEIQGLDFSNTVALFGIYEPVDMKQYQYGLLLNFRHCIPVRSPHAVHEELYYRGMIENMAKATDCESFLQAIPRNFFDDNPPLVHSDTFQKAYHETHLITEKEIDILLRIEHPSAFWCLLKLSKVYRDEDLFIKIEKAIQHYFETRTDGFATPSKFMRQIKLIREKFAN